MAVNKLVAAETLAEQFAARWTDPAARLYAAYYTYLLMSDVEISFALWNSAVMRAIRGEK